MPTLQANVAASPGGKWACTFRMCNHRFSNMEECLLHLGVQHTMAALLAKHSPESAVNVPCPYCKEKKDNMDKIVRHIILKHCQVRFCIGKANIYSILPSMYIVYIYLLVISENYYTHTL